MKLSFQPFKDLLKRTPYVAVASFLGQTGSRIREGNEVQVVDDSDFNVYVSNAAMSSSLAVFLCKIIGLSLMLPELFDRMNSII